MSKRVFLNTSAVQYLYQLGLLHLIRDLFGKAYVPNEVYQEIEAGRKEGVELPDLKGETAVILLGLEHPDSLVILDDRLARKVARELGVKVTGTSGILIAAKKKGLIESVKAYLDKLRDLGFYLAPKHRAAILKEAGEVG